MLIGTWLKYSLFVKVETSLLLFLLCGVSVKIRIPWKENTYTISFPWGNIVFPKHSLIFLFISCLIIFVLNVVILFLFLVVDYHYTSVPHYCLSLRSTSLDLLINLVSLNYRSRKNPGSYPSLC